MEQPLQHGLRYGKYCPGEDDTCVDFYVYQNPKGEAYGYIFNFITPVQNIVSLFKIHEFTPIPINGLLLDNK